MNSMKKTLLIILALGFSANAYAKIAVVNSQYILEHSKMTKKATAEIKAAAEKAQKLIEVKRQKLMKKKDDLLAKKDVLSADAYSKKKAELENEILAFRKYFKKTEKSLGIQNKQAMQKNAEDITQIVEDVAKKEGYDIVVSKALLLYSSEKVDITQKVLKILDNQSNK